MQVHNFLDWEAHLPTLQGDEGRRDACATSASPRRTAAATTCSRSIMRERAPSTSCSSPTTSNDREAEERLLPTGRRARASRSIVNRPFDGGEQFGAKTARPLPGWAAEIGCTSWAEAFLKCDRGAPGGDLRDPATSKLAHCPREHARAVRAAAGRGAAHAAIAADYVARLAARRLQRPPARPCHAAVASAALRPRRAPQSAARMQPFHDTPRLPA